MTKLLKSKKTIATLTTGIVAAIARVGFGADPEFVAVIVTIGLGYVALLWRKQRKPKPATGGAK